LSLYAITPRFVEPTTGIEPVNPILTKDVLYLLSYVGPEVARDLRVMGNKRRTGM
jgi:hypothetical protein